jgi:seryl-tRNA synthetase
MDTLHGVAEPLAAAAVELQALQQQLFQVQQQHKAAVQQLQQQLEKQELREQEAVAKVERLSLELNGRC